MTEYHELTQKWKESNTVNFSDLDKLIRSYLSEKAKEFNDYGQWKVEGKSSREILGLEPEKVEWCSHIREKYSKNCPDITHWVHYDWSEKSIHMGGYAIHSWEMFCPICAASRPSDHIIDANKKVEQTTSEHNSICSKYEIKGTARLKTQPKIHEKLGLRLDSPSVDVRSALKDKINEIIDYLKASK